MRDKDAILSLNSARYLARDDLSGQRQFQWDGDLQIDGIVYPASLLAGFGKRSGRLSLDLTHPTPGHIETIRFSIIQRPSELIVNTRVLNEGVEIPGIETTHTHLKFKQTETVFSPLTVADIATSFPTEEDLKERTATPEQLDLYHMWELGDALKRKFEAEQ